jgi:hypothetical protein
MEETRNRLASIGFPTGWRFVLGIQVRTFDSRRPPRVVNQGQTIVELISTGT